MRTTWITGVCIFSFMISAFAQNPQSFSEPANDPNSLEAYLRYAALNNAGLRAAYEAWQMELLAVVPAGTLADPQLEYSYFVNQTPMGDRNRLRLMQMFPWFGVLEVRKDAAAAAAKAAHKRYEARHLELNRQVKQGFYEYVYLGQAIRIAEQNLELLKSFEQTAQVRYRTAAGGHPDILRAQIELAEMEQSLISLQQMRSPASAGLSAILNRPSKSLLPWPQRGEGDLATVNTDAVNQLLLASNPDLKALDFEAAAARSRVKLAEKRFYPDVSFGVEWMDLDGGEMGENRDGRDPLVALVAINLPIWTDSYRSQANQARSEVRKIQRQQEQKELDLSTEVSQVVFNLDDTRRKTILYRDTLVPKAREMVATSLEAYRAGNLDFLSLVDAQRKLLEYELAMERSLSSHLQQQAELERLLGGNLPILSQD